MTRSTSPEASVSDDTFLADLKECIDRRADEIIATQVSERSRGCMDPATSRLAAIISVRSELQEWNEAS